MNCYEAIDLMDDAIEGLLEPPQDVGLVEHLDECPPCRHYYEQLQLTCRALENLPPPGVSGERRAELIARFKQEFRKD